MANYEDDIRDTNYFRTLPELSRGGGGTETGSANAQYLIDRIKGVVCGEPPEIKDPKNRMVDSGGTFIETEA